MQIMAQQLQVYARDICFGAYYSGLPPGLILWTEFPFAAGTPQKSCSSISHHDFIQKYTNLWAPRLLCSAMQTKAHWVNSTWRLALIILQFFEVKESEKAQTWTPWFRLMYAFLYHEAKHGSDSCWIVRYYCHRNKETVCQKRLKHYPLT